MRSKLVWIFSVSFIVLLGALAWKVDRDYVEDKIKTLRMLSRSQLLALSRSVDTELVTSTQMIELLLPQLKAGSSVDYPETSQFGKFQMIATLNPPGRSSSDWRFESMYLLANAEIKSWAPSALTMLLQNFKEADVPVGFRFVLVVQGPDKKKSYLAIIYHFGSQWLVGIVKSDLFRNLTDRQKGDAAGTVFLVNSLGQVLAHPTAQYVGTILSDHPAVSEIVSGASASGGGFVKEKNGGSYNFYEQTSGSNVYAVTSTSEEILLAERKANLIGLLALGLGIGAFAGVAVYLVFRGEVEFEDVTSSFPALPPLSENSGLLSVEKKSETGKERMDAYQKVASSLSHEVRGPITSILGALQLLRVNLKSNPSAANECIDQLEVQARSAREVTQKLLAFAGEESSRPTPTQLDEPLNKALKMLEAKISAKGVKLNKNISSTKVLPMDSRLLSRAFEALLVNAIEAMERAPKKELSVTLSSSESSVILKIADSGEGMTAEELNRAFDPFFTTRSAGHHMGLGLSMAQGVIREAGGDITLQSEKGKGTTLTVTFSIVAEKKIESVGLAASNAAAGSVAATPPVANPAAAPKWSEPKLKVDITGSALAALRPSSPPLEAPLQSAIKVPQRPTAVRQQLAQLEPEPAAVPSPEPAPAAAPSARTVPPTQENFVDDSMEKLIDEVDLPSEKKSLIDAALEATTDTAIEKTTGKAPLAATRPVSSKDPLQEIAELEKRGFSAKIDKPNFELKRKSPKRPEIVVPVRKPGDKA